MGETSHLADTPITGSGIALSYHQILLVLVLLLRDAPLLPTEACLLTWSPA
jgi:hypothetical protein